MLKFQYNKTAQQQLVKELGILQKDIQTDRLSINPTYKDRLRYTNQYNEIEGYLVINSLVVTLTEVNKIEELVTKALQSGVNHIVGLEFQTTEFKWEALEFAA